MKKGWIERRRWIAIGWGILLCRFLICEDISRGGGMRKNGISGEMSERAGRREKVLIDTSTK